MPLADALWGVAALSLVFVVLVALLLSLSLWN